MRQIDSALEQIRGTDFRLAHLETMLAPVNRAKGRDPMLLAELPARLPKLLRFAFGRSAELGGEDAFGFTSVRDRPASAEGTFAFSRDREATYVIGLDLGEDPEIVRDPRPVVAHLSTFIQIRALETVLATFAGGTLRGVNEELTSICRARLLERCPELTSASLDLLTFGADLRG